MTLFSNKGNPIFHSKDQLQRGRLVATGRSSIQLYFHRCKVFTFLATLAGSRCSAFNTTYYYFIAIPAAEAKAWKEAEEESLESATHCCQMTRQSVKLHRPVFHRR